MHPAFELEGPFEGINRLAPHGIVGTGDEYPLEALLGEPCPHRLVGLPGAEARPKRVGRVVRLLEDPVGRRASRDPNLLGADRILLHGIADCAAQDAEQDVDIVLLDELARLAQALLRFEFVVLDGQRNRAACDLVVFFGKEHLDAVDFVVAEARHATRHRRKHANLQRRALGHCRRRDFQRSGNRNRTRRGSVRQQFPARQTHSLHHDLTIGLHDVLPFGNFLTMHCAASSAYPLAEIEPAIHFDHLASDEARGVRCQENRDIGDIVGLRETAERGAADGLRFQLIRPCGCHRRIDHSRVDRIHPNAECAHIPRQRSAQTDHTAFRRDIGRSAAHATNVDRV